jgi:predicted membrane metal-binding protein
MGWGEMLTRGLAQLAAACYLLRVLADIGRSQSPSLNRGKRWLWTLGCLALWLHVAAAFEFFHHWSHAEAVRQTAEQTRELTGWAWGGGVSINYAFAGFWLWDVIAWWRTGLDYPNRQPWRYWITQAVFAFLIVNATVVFGPRYWLFVGAVFAVICVWATRRGDR